MTACFSMGMNHLNHTCQYRNNFHFNKHYTCYLFIKFLHRLHYRHGCKLPLDLVEAYNCAVVCLGSKRFWIPEAYVGYKTVRNKKCETREETSTHKNRKEIELPPSCSHDYKNARSLLEMTRLHFWLLDAAAWWYHSHTCDNHTQTQFYKPFAWVYSSVTCLG